LSVSYRVSKPASHSGIISKSFSQSVNKLASQVLSVSHLASHVLSVI